MSTALIVIINIVLALTVVTAIIGLLAGSIVSDPANRELTRRWRGRRRQPARARSSRGRLAGARPAG